MKRVLAQFGRRERPANDQHAPERQEPRTGVVRKVNVSPERASALSSQSGVRARGDTSAPPLRASATRVANPNAWRCLEWGERPAERPAKRNPKVSIVHLSMDGQLLSQTGPEQGLAPAAVFMQRMAALVAQGLGFEHCRSVCLRNEASALSVSQTGPAKIVAVAGPARQMPNVLRRAGLE
jgi:hypothetical protein